MGDNQVYNSGSNVIEGTVVNGKDLGHESIKNVSPVSVKIPTDPNRYYKMDHRKRGIALIFNHEYYEKNHADPRFGTNVDCCNLRDTLEDLGFEVEIIGNATRKQIKNQLKRVAKMDHSDHDCLAVVVMTHGELGVLHAYDTTYKTETIWSCFTSDVCPTLAGKPKLFFIQACQGDLLDRGSELMERTTSDGPPEPSLRQLHHPDFLIAYSHIPGYYSWRNEAYGSWFMESLCKELRKNGTRGDILKILTFVSQRVAINYESNTPDDPEMHGRKQVPCITSTLTRLMRFTPRSEVPQIGNGARGGV